MGLDQAGVLRIHLREMHLPKLQARQIYAAQDAPEQPQQVDGIAGPKALLRKRTPAPAFQQRKQELFRAIVRPQATQDGFTEQSLLRLAYVVVCLRLDKRLLNQQERTGPGDLVGHILNQPIRHELEDNRLEREG